MKKHRQFHATPLRPCTRCGQPSRKTEKVSDRIVAGGGYLCPECLVPAAAERNMTSSDNGVRSDP